MLSLSVNYLKTDKNLLQPHLFPMFADQAQSSSMVFSKGLELLTPHRLAMICTTFLGIFRLLIQGNPPSRNESLHRIDGLDCKLGVKFIAFENEDYIYGGASNVVRGGCERFRDVEVRAIK